MNTPRSVGRARTLRAARPLQENPIPTKIAQLVSVKPDAPGDADVGRCEQPPICWIRLALWQIGYNWKMRQTRFHLGALVGFALSIACSGTDGGPTVASGGKGFSDAGRAGSSGADSSASGGLPSGGSGLSNGGAQSSAGSGPTGGSPNGGVANAGGVSGGIAAGGTAAGGVGGANSGGKASGGASVGGAGGKASGGSNAGGVGSGGKGSAGSSAGGTGSGGKGSGGSGGASACPEVDSQLCGMTGQHNQARASVKPVPSTPLPSMSWDATVAATAQAWADQCNFTHNTAGYGQNLYASAGGGPPTPTAVVSSWVSEVSAYDYSANTCSGTCGHYTQVVWRNSILLGCGIKSCSTNTPFGAQFPNWYIVVCNYSPAGNNGSRPY